MLCSSANMTAVDVDKSASMWASWVQSVANRDKCWYALLMYQLLMHVGYENVPLFCIRPDESLLSLMLAFNKGFFGEFSSFLIILFLFVVYYSS